MIDKEQELLKQVKKEATKLRDNITEEERNKLNYATLAGTSRRRCIYGQITGDCNSYRATNLIKLCAEKVYINKAGENHFANIKLSFNKLNGSPKNLIRNQYFSPIEVLLYDKKKYIYENDNTGIIKKLVNFLKKDSDTLNF